MLTCSRKNDYLYSLKFSPLRTIVFPRLNFSYSHPEMYQYQGESSMFSITLSLV